MDDLRGRSAFPRHEGSFMFVDFAILRPLLRGREEIKNGGTPCQSDWYKEQQRRLDVFSTAAYGFYQEDQDGIFSQHPGEEESDAFA